MNIVFTSHAWEDYEYWLQTDKAMIKRIHMLIKDIRRDPFAGIGKPEPLKHQYAGFWSRRIDDEHRLIYCIRDSALQIIQCRYHYE